jgi:phosphoribosyl-ATP pyrophosphohydrolase/phosphoribosyl-AMP cyclohydrolase
MNIDFEKSGGLVPAIVQDALTMQVLMLEKNLAEGKVTFFGRSKTTIVDQG